MAKAVVGDRHRHVRLVIVVRDARLAVVAFGDHVLVGTGLGEGERTEGEVGSVAVARLAHGDRGLLRSGRPVHSLDHERELAAFRPLSARQFLRERHAFRHTVELLGGVGVDEVGLVHNRLGFQLAVAVVGHRHSHRGLVVIEGDTRHDAGELLDRVGVGACLGVGDVTEREVRLVTLRRLVHGLGEHAVLRALRHRSAVLARQREREHAVVRPCGARQLLGERHARGHTRELLGGVCIDELAAISTHIGFKLPLAIVGHRHGHLRRMPVVGNTRHIALRLLDHVLIRARLGEGDITETEVRRVTLVRLAHRLRQHAILRAFRHWSAVLALERELEGTVSRPLDAGQLLRQTQIRRTNRHLLRRVGVGERAFDHRRSGFQLAFAVVSHRHGHLCRMPVVGYARHVALRLLDRVLVGTRLGVGDAAEREVRLGTLAGLAHRDLRLGRHRRVLRHGFERELEGTILRPINTGQLLGERHARGHASELLGGIGVGELTAIGLHRGLKLTLAVVTHRHGHLGGMRVIGHARHIALRFLDRVGVDAHLGIGDVAEHDVRGITVGRLADRDVELAVLRALRHRGIALGRKRELEGAVSRPLDAGQLL